MRRIKKGDIVTRKSYNNDIEFRIEDIIHTKTMDIAILKGLIIRIEASSPLDDLIISPRRVINQKLNEFDKNLSNKINECLININKKKDVNEENQILNVNNEKKRIIFGRNYQLGSILHIDGDRSYAEKSLRFYRSLGLNATVKSITESKQPMQIEYLIGKYNPDILVITGHDGMIKKSTSFNDMNNYRNSRYFAESVRIARKIESKSNKIAIFAGACQSYYEAIMEAGANFASSPARILIDFMDPLIVAKKIATTFNNQYISILDIEKELRNGQKGVSGIGTYGKMRYM